MTDENSATINDAKEKCKQILAKLPIIKSKAENTFILGLMSKNKAWVWLGMERRHGKMAWFDDAPAEPSDGALYSAWSRNEPSNKGNEDCAYVDFFRGTWNDNTCDFGQGAGPLVLCQRERKKHG